MSRTSSHISINEKLLFEVSSPGRRAYDFPPLDVPPRSVGEIVDASLLRDGIEGMPELSEVDVVRHFTRLSTWNYHIDLGLYPLGSCTMKYNPKINEVATRLPGFATLHPYMPDDLVQGALHVQATLESCLAEISGMDAVTLQPAAGAHGELTGILMIRAYHEARGNPRKTVLVPDSAHGTNPASVTISGYAVQQIPSSPKGTIDLEGLRKVMSEDVAAIMITNPNTLGIFECDDGYHASGRLRHRRPAHQSTQNIYHATRWWRPGGRSCRGEEAPGTASSLSRADEEGRGRLFL
jgi:glycine dehydrogenase subunit 2